MKKEYLILNDVSYKIVSSGIRSFYKELHADRETGC